MNSENMDELKEIANKQLKILSEIQTIIKSLDASFWLRGGWGIDFILGRITRPHSDIDLVTWVKHRLVIEEALIEADFEKIPVSQLQTDFLKDGVDVSFVFVTRSTEGLIVANGIPDWVWRSDALPTKNYNLNGISAYVLSPYQLLEEKEVYEQGTGRKPRLKDLESMKILRNMINTSKSQ